MFKKVCLELIAIRKELQAIRHSLESKEELCIVREPYSTNYKVVRVGRDGSLDA